MARRRTPSLRATVDAQGNWKPCLLDRAVSRLRRGEPLPTDWAAKLIEDGICVSTLEDRIAADLAAGIRR